MEQLIKRITEKTGLNADQARSAASAVISFLKEKMPAPIAGQLDNYIGESDKSSGTGGNTAGGSLGDMGSKLGGMFGKNR